MPLAVSLTGYDSDIVLSAFNQALRIYNRSPETRLPRVSVHYRSCPVRCDGATVPSIVDGAMPIAAAHENAAFLRH
jgi:hypothetical protein